MSIDKDARIAELERKLAEQQAIIFNMRHPSNLGNWSFADAMKAVNESDCTELNNLLAKAKEEGRKDAVPEGWQVVPKSPICGKNYDAGLWSRRNYDAWLEDQLTSAQSAAWLEASHIEWMKGLKAVGYFMYNEFGRLHRCDPRAKTVYEVFPLYAIPTKKD